MLSLDGSILRKASKAENTYMYLGDGLGVGAGVSCSSPDQAFPHELDQELPQESLTGFPLTT